MTIEVRTMTTENSCADALRTIAEFPVTDPANMDALNMRRIACAALDAGPSSQPAAAPIDSGTVSVACFSGGYPHGTITYSQLAPSPADERAAFDLTDMEWLKVFERVSASIPNVFGSYMKASAAFAREAIRLAEEARVASANETGVEGVRAWETDDGRVISDEQKQQALRDGGASASSVRPFSIALVRIGAVPAMAAEAVAIYQVRDGVDSWADTDPVLFYDAPDTERRIVYTTPQPAQADARVGLTDALRRAREELSIVEWENDPPSRVVKLFDEIDALLAVHPGQPEPNFVSRWSDAIRSMGKPEPRAEAVSDDQRDVVRWRTLMKNGEPEVFVERTQRRVIQRTQPVAFSNPNLTGADRFDTPSEMWVKRYVMFAWWARENEHRKFIEAVDAIAAGTIQ